MVPYAVPGAFLIILDLIHGVRAAKYRGERVRLSTAINRTMTKTFSYVCWIILASTLALAFKVDWVEWLVLGLVYANELISIIGNYLETKGMELSLANLYRWAFKKAGEKVGMTVEDAEAEGIIKEKQPRDAKGRFVKKEDNG